MWYFDICKKDMEINANLKHLISNTHIHRKGYI